MIRGFEHLAGRLDSIATVDVAAELDAMELSSGLRETFPPRSPDSSESPATTELS